MKIWLINTHELLPTDGDDVRLLRMGMLAEHLAERGHSVVWWTGSFAHQKRQHRCDQDSSEIIDDNYEIRILRVPSYGGNISLRRLLNNYQFARKFRQEARKIEPPDLVMSSYPTIDVSYAAVNYGRQFGVPSVIDLRDMWPDIFVEHAPRWAKPAVRLVFSPWFLMAKRTFAGATVLTGHTRDFVEWGQRVGGRKDKKCDQDFPHSYRRPTLKDSERASSVKFWRDHGITADHDVVCFFGGIGHALDLGPVFDAARRLCAHTNIRFVICGNGSLLQAAQDAAADLPNVIFSGWVGVPEINVLLELSKIGLAPWKPTPDYESTISNKIVEYFSAGVPVLTSLDKGLLVNVLAEHQCGFSYKASGSVLADQINQYLANPAELEKSSNNAFALYEDRFDSAKVVSEFADHLESIAAGRTTHRDETAHVVS